MNNKMIKSLLVAALTLSAAHLSADAGHTNKTFLMPRAQGVNLPMHTTTFYDLVNRKAQDKFGANFQVTGFWQQSADGSEQGKYFLADNKSTIDVSRANAASTASTIASTVDLGLLLHEYNLGGGPETANSNTLSLDPQQEVYGVRLDYHQDLHKLVKGLYLSANLPVVNVSNDPRLSVKANANGLATADNIKKLFAGTYVAAAAKNSQAALTKGKISGSRSETGVADIDVVLGYKFLNKAKYHAAVGLAATLPTGNEATGDWLFEPMVGNGGHWALGGDFCAGARVWEGEEQALNVNLALKYRYLFEANERRVLGLKGTGVNNRKLAQYQLLGEAGKTSLVPAANVLAMNCDVTPGSQLDANLGMSYHRGGFSVDLGYNMYFREDESVKRKDSLKESTYGVAARDVQIDTAFRPGTPGDFDGNAVALLSNDNIDTSAAETPSQFTNAIYGGAGYVFKNWDCPLMLGLGAKYEWANKNSALEQWGAWLKVGVGF